jgi:hypothetical protein
MEQRRRFAGGLRRAKGDPRSSANAFAIVVLILFVITAFAIVYVNVSG